jgi:tetratricopeptide (TPR) repeat protein
MNLLSICLPIVRGTEWLLPARRGIACALLSTALVLVAPVCVAAQKSSSKERANARDPAALVANAEQALKQKQYRSAVQLLVQAASIGDDESLAQRATETAFAHNQYSFTIQAAERWLQINPTSEDARKLAGFAALQLFRIDTAVTHFDSLIASAFISPQAGFVALAPQWAQEGSRPAVLALMQRLLPKYDQLAEAHFVYAQAAMQSENSEAALLHAQRAVELSPYWMPAKWMLARAQLIVGQKDTAIKSARDIAEEEDSTTARLELGQFLMAAGEIEASRKELVPLTNDPSIAPRAQRILAIMEMDDESDSALRRWRDLVISGNYAYEGMYYLGQISERRNAIRDAIDLYSRVIDGDYVVGAQTRAAYLKAREGKANDGIAHLQEFLRGHEEYAIEVINAQAVLLEEMGDGKQAIEVLDEGLAIYPEVESLRVTKALLLEKTKRTSQALEVMRALVRDRPEDPSAMNMLGYTLVDSSRQIREGYELIKKALKALPDSGAVQDSMGWVLHKMDRNDEAMPYLQKAMESAHDAEIAIHMGEVQWALGKRDEAIATWESALKDFPNHSALQEKLKKKR